SEAQGVGNAVALLLAELQRAPALDAQCRPWRMQPVRQPLGIAYQPGGTRVLADAHEHALARRPWPRDRVRLHMGEQLLVHALGRAAECELAQRSKVAGREIMRQRALGLLRDVDLSFLEA